jgi:hypothetical protein
LSARPAKWTRRSRRTAACSLVLLVAAWAAPAVLAATGVHTAYLWHMHQPIYWPDASTWTPGRYETAYETITLGHSQSDVFAIFDKDDRVGDYQWYPNDAISSMLDLPEAGAQISFAGVLTENIASLAAAGWNGGCYASDWYAPYRQARGWLTSQGTRRADLLLVGFHHAIAPLMDEDAFRMELACAKEIHHDAWGDDDVSRGFFPAEMCFSERLIPALIDAGVTWSIVADIHLARACAGYPYLANEDNCDPPNPADQLEPVQSDWTHHYIDRGVTVKVPYPLAFTPHRAQYVDPATGGVSSLVVVPAAMAVSWEEGYGMFGTAGIDAIAGANDPTRPMLVLFAHDGDNAWSGGWSYYHESVPQFSHQAAAAGYTPTTVAGYLADHPVPAGDVVHVEDGGWVNADGDFGSPQFINWNWPLVNQTGGFDIPGGWAEDERNWAVLTAAQNRVETAAQIIGAVDPARVVDPLSGANDAERAYHFLLAGYESGYMYYGASLDMEIKATLACNEATLLADPIVAMGPDLTPPAIWLPQRLAWNPGGRGGGSLWGYPGGEGASMSPDFHVWTFVHDAAGLARVELMLREDGDGWNDPTTTDNEIYAGGNGVGAWEALPMTRRLMPLGEPWEMGAIDFPELPRHIADEYWLQVSGRRGVLLDYYVEAEDSLGNVARSPIQHVWVGEGGGGGFLLDGELDDGVPVLAAGSGLTLWGRREGDVLYLACEGVGGTAGLDHFLLVSTASGTMRTAPWAKSGQAMSWAWFLGAEDANNWCGWFDATEAVQAGSGFAAAQGTVLEGTLDLAELCPDGAPQTLWLSAAAYTSPDGGVLVRQAPAGNGDGRLDPDEYYRLEDPLSAGPARLGPPALRMSLGPNPFNPRVAVDVQLEGAAADLTVEVFDARGRRLAVLHRGRGTPGVLHLTWDGRDRQGAPSPSGIYLFRARTAGRQTVVKGCLSR